MNAVDPSLAFEECEFDPDPHVTHMLKDLPAWKVSQERKGGVLKLSNGEEVSMDKNVVRGFPLLMKAEFFCDKIINSRKRGLSFLYNCKDPMWRVAVARAIVKKIRALEAQECGGRCSKERNH